MRKHVVSTGISDADIFTFSTIKEESKECTKGNVLEAVLSIFDPLGFTSPFVVSTKVFLEKLWRSKVDWMKCSVKDIKSTEKNGQKTSKLPKASKPQDVIMYWIPNKVHLAARIY